ncbi:MAG: TPM domain-containing protein [Flavobacterium sp.]|nr:TPM domain-containing protein [Flavobacterium sp.]
MSKVENFLSQAEEQEIVQAICIAERNTSGEIRVHLEKTTSISAINRAKEVFMELEMHKTKDANGVLIYLAVENKLFAICGDSGIDKVVPIDFWDKTKQAIANNFQRGKFKQGLIDGIIMAGEQLKNYFPYDNENDVNELPNEISKG